MAQMQSVRCSQGVCVCVCVCVCVRLSGLSAELCNVEASRACYVLCSLVDALYTL